MPTSYEGNGDAKFPDGSIVNGDFKIVIESNGKAYLELVAKTGITAYHMGLPREEISFQGHEKANNGLVNITKMYMTGLHFPGANISFYIPYSFEVIYNEPDINDDIILTKYLSNFIFYGDEISKYGKEFRRDKISVNINGKNLVIKQVENFKEVEEYFKKERNVRVTCSIEIPGKFHELKALRELSDDVESIISLGSCNFVTVLHEDIFSKNVLCKTYQYPLKTYPYNSGKPLINTNIHDIDRFKQFIVKGYPKYRLLKNDLALPYVIEFFNSAKIYRISQPSFILNCVALECFYNKYQRWRAMPPVTSLGSKIKDLCDDIGVTYTTNDLDLRITRNHLMHEGDFPSGINPINEKDRLENLFDKMLLSLLAYQGNIYYNVFTRSEDTL